MRATRRVRSLPYWTVTANDLAGVFRVTSRSNWAGAFSCAWSIICDHNPGLELAHMPSDARRHRPSLPRLGCRRGHRRDQPSAAAGNITGSFHDDDRNLSARPVGPASSANGQRIGAFIELPSRRAFSQAPGNRSALEYFAAPAGRRSRSPLRRREQGPDADRRCQRGARFQQAAAGCTRMNVSPVLRGASHEKHSQQAPCKFAHFIIRLNYNMLCKKQGHSSQVDLRMCT